VTHEPNLAARARRNILVRDGRIDAPAPGLQVATCV